MVGCQNVGVSYYPCYHAKCRREDTVVTPKNFLALTLSDNTLYSITTNICMYTLKVEDYHWLIHWKCTVNLSYQLDFAQPNKSVGKWPWPMASTS